MSSIPNLNTLRRGRGGPRLRGRRGGGTEGHNAEPSEAGSLDKIIQRTDNDASSSRLSAVELGYLQDEYARNLTTPGEAAPRRYPLINRGTYVRTEALDRLVFHFLRSTSTRRQVISLGAGSDTRYFRLLADFKDVVYHELDFETNITAKREAIDRSPLLATRRRTLEAAGCAYYLHSVDLRDLRADSPVVLNGLEADISTLILSECCLCYLPHEEASAALAYFTSRLSNAMALILYEPIRPHDAFGRTMVTNLASRGIHLQTVKRYASLEAQRQRLKQAGFTDLQGARDVFQIWSSDSWITTTERERVERLEWLDEVEEWNLLASHYCIAWACRGKPTTSAWQHLQGDATQDEMLKDE
ncbi:hypothetical protein AMS68_001834 [Peltaster fructicola]|uniref:Leucine carboxyl methyltransferase 1 n=1 Tax=Peltaster fructicola TaxID=286661 RepID=A0A6H0XNI4_9PEZI|nr:hypothetical protein AMS68_001834 [Peltaster fructicola]